MRRHDFPLEPTSDEVRALIGHATERITRYLDSLPSQPAAYSGGALELARDLAEPLPETGTSYDELLDTIFDRATPRSFNTAGPGYLAYIPGGGVFESALADLIGESINRYVGVWLAAPGLAEIEANVVRWFAEIVGYPTGAGGFLTSGGSLANFGAVVTARHARLPENFLGGTIYTSEHAHHSIQKAAMLAGFPARNVRSIACDERFCVRVDAMARAIANDRAQGLTPFLIVGNAGTTNTGAVDDLDALATLARANDLWFHVDAAYGGFFMLTARGRSAMRGIERSDSATLDPHKGLFLPYGTGSLVVRDRAALERAHAMDADYLPALPDADDILDFSRLSPELTRPFRGLRVWLPVKHHGIDSWRRQLDEKLDLTMWATDALRQMPEIDVVAEPQLSVVAFRLRDTGESLDAANARNRRLLDAINAPQRVHLSATMLDGRFTLRICVLSFRTHQDRMNAGLENIRAAVKAVCDIQ